MIPNSTSIMNWLQVSRRRALQIGGLGGLGLTLPRVAQANPRACRAKTVLFLFQWGGPSHVDMFDMKPYASEAGRSHFGTIPTSIPGYHISDQLPQMAKVMDRFTVVRSVHHHMVNHNSAAYYALTGHAPATDDIRLRDTVDLFPAYGSVVSKLAPNVNQMPTFVSYPYVLKDGEVTPGQHASFLGKVHDPFFFSQDPNRPDFSLPELSLPAGLSYDRLTQRRELQKLINDQLDLAESSSVARGLEEYYERCLRMLNSPRVKQAFQLSDEPAYVRDQYGRTTYGQSCLLARRLAESGVKFVNVYFSEHIGGRHKDNGWDTHGFDNTRMYPIIKDYQLPLTDQTLPALVLDLEQRGLLDETLVLWMGEFGRTPKLNANISRDHWPHCYTVLMAGGGMRRGYVYGESDQQGAYPAKDPVHLEDLMATVFAAVGIDPETEVRDRQNRPLPVSYGRVVNDLFA